MTIPAKSETLVIWPSDLDEIDVLEYYLEFFPKLNNISSTNYSLRFSEINESIVNISVSFDNLLFTTEEVDFNYSLSLDTNKINSTNISDYDSYLNNHTTELFLNLSDIGNPQVFRVDEMVMFSPYFRTTAESAVEDHELEFKFVGIEEFGVNDSWLTPLSTYHYNASYSWQGAGCT